MTYTVAREAQTADFCEDHKRADHLGKVVPEVVGNHVTKKMAKGLAQLPLSTAPHPLDPHCLKT
jgi:hypothetical protein